MANDQVGNIEGEHQGDDQKKENDRNGQKHSNCPCTFGHFGWAMAILDFMTFYAFPPFFHKKYKKEPPYPLPYGRRGRGKWRWPMTKLRIYRGDTTEKNKKRKMTDIAKNTATVLVYLAILVGPWPF